MKRRGKIGFLVLIIALFVYQKAMCLSVETTDKTNLSLKNQALDWLNTSVLWFNEKNNTDSAKYYANLAMSLARDNQYDSLFHAARITYITFVIDDETTEGLKEWIEEDIRYQEANSLHIDLAKSYNVLGNYHFVRSELNEALKAYQQSIDYEEILGNEFGMAISKFNLGFLLQRMGRYEDAYANIRYGYNYMHHQQDSNRMLRADLGLSDLFAKENPIVNPIYNLDSSTYHAQNGLLLAEKLQFPYGIMRAQRSLSHSLIHQGQFEVGLSLISEMRENYSQFLHENDHNFLDLNSAFALDQV